MSEEKEEIKRIGFCPNCGEDWEGIIRDLGEGKWLVMCESCGRDLLIHDVTGRVEVRVRE